jgi:hypothetical protein
VGGQDVYCKGYKVNIIKVEGTAYFGLRIKHSVIQGVAADICKREQ